MADANWRPHTPSDFDKSSTPTIDRHSFFQKAASPPKSAKSQRRFPGSPPPPERENEKEKKTAAMFGFKKYGIFCRIVAMVGGGKALVQFSSPMAAPPVAKASNPHMPMSPFIL